MANQDSTSPSDFSDRRVIITTYDDSRLAQVSNDSIRYEQSCDGPTYLVIRKNAENDSLTKAAVRFGIPIRDLTEFRAYQAR